MSSFKITKLLAQRAIIEGTDVTGKTDSVVVSTVQWDHIQAHVRQDAEAKALDDAFRKFYQPLSEAVAAIQDAAPTTDPLLTYVFDEGVPAGAEARPAQVHTLGHEAVLLRAIETGDPATLNRLRWVNVGGAVSLEIAAADEVETLPAVDRYEDQLAAVREAEEVAPVIDEPAESVDPGSLF